MLESLKDVLPLHLFQSDCCFDFMNVLLVLCMPQLPSIRAARDIRELKIVSPAIDTQPLHLIHQRRPWQAQPGGCATPAADHSFGFLEGLKDVRTLRLCQSDWRG